MLLCGVTGSLGIPRKPNMKIPVVLLILMFPSTALAHGGGLDAHGCHNDRKLGGYHCHRGALASQSFQSKEEALKGTDRSPKDTDARSVSGMARVIDGDTIEINRKRIRLHGIDAPEQKQKCLDASQSEYPCGEYATNALRRKVQSAHISCTVSGVDPYKRLIAVCYIGTQNINNWLVKRGWAIAYKRYSNDYVSTERTARIERNGIWKGSFVEPWKWRKGSRQN
jgi:endonuclease YncB( thermonuclease family)